MILPRIMIAAPAGSSGKTTITLGLLAALKERGMEIGVFKVGADYIDPQLHAAVLGKPSRNVDSWLMDEQVVRYLFQKNASAEVNIIEGVCGLFDGGDDASEAGSSAHIAKILHTPVILVVNAIGSFRSLAAEVYGFSTFDKGITIAGVILNNIGSETHYRWTKQAIEKATRIPVIGYVPYETKYRLKERHLGLIPAEEQLLSGGFITDLRQAIEKYIDIEKLLQIATKASSLSPVHLARAKKKQTRNVAIAKDKAFNFYYQDNFELLTELGAELTFFSPLSDTQIPVQADVVYLGGGFPEYFLNTLSQNKPMIESIRTFATAGGRLYAECGGLLYLSQAITDKAGKRHAMVGALPFATRWSDRLKISFVRTKARQNTLLAKKNQIFRGQEFHMFEIDSSAHNNAWDVLTHQGRVEGYATKNILASFIHRHFWSDPHMAENLLSE